MPAPIRPLLLCCILLASASAGDTSRATHAVAKQRLRPVLSLSGILAARPLAEVRFAPEACPDNLLPSILEISDAGRRVLKGDVILRLDPARIDDMLKEATAAAQAAEEEARIAHEEFKAQVITGDAALATAEAECRLAESKLATFREAETPLRKREKALGTLGQSHAVADQEEELRQLEAMYRASELAHETKEIVLERARRNLERQRTAEGLTKMREGILAERELPQEEARLVAETDQKRESLKAAQISRKAQMDRKRLDVDKAERQRDAARQRLDRLGRDRKQMTVTAPEDGVVTHLSARAAMGGDDLGASRLSPGDRIQPFAPLLTLLPPSPALVACRRATGREAARLAAGLQANVTLPAHPDLTLKASLSRVGLLPLGKEALFEIVFDLAGADPRLKPGMEARIEVALPSPGPEVIGIPLSAVRKEGERSLCTVMGTDGVQQARELTLGDSDGEFVEVRKGLQVGERVLLGPDGKS